MTPRNKFRTTFMTLALAASTMLGCSATAAFAQDSMQLSARDVATKKPVHLGINKSMVIDLPAAAGDVLVSNPGIADAVLRTSSRLYLIGVKLGQANVFLFDNAGHQILSLDVYVDADLSTLNNLLAEAIPEGSVHADALNGSVILRGQVPSAADAGRAQEIAGKMIGALVTSSTSENTTGSGAAASSTANTQSYDNTNAPGIVNLITITGEEQVALKVTIAEVQREVIKQLGINVTSALDSGGFQAGSLVNGLSPLSFPVGVGSAVLGYSHGKNSIGATLEALDQTKMLKTLAEPTLTAVSGETANFLAGGEFPFVTGIDKDTGTRTVEFKPFGVQLAFTPVVLSAGRISLKVRAEVSEIASVDSGVPTINTRRAESTVELPSGGSFVLAGLMQENMQRQLSGFPGLSKIPVIGALFSSKDFLNRNTELVMIVTPYLVKPVSPQALTQPDKNLVLSNDAETYFLGRLTKIYGNGTPQANPVGHSKQVGFSFD